MSLQIALNGNSTGPNDPNFIHFTDEQSGILLPSIPGYPTWLPQLQLTATGRLCFWNFPNVFKKSVVSNPANVGTFNFLRDAKAGGWNPAIGINTDMGTNGSGNEYVWGACDTYLINQKSNTFYQTLIPNSWDYPSYAGDRNGGTMSQKLIGWMFLNAQFYINKYIVKPFNIENAGDGFWPAGLWFENMQSDGKLAEYLSNTNLLIPLYNKPGFWEKMGAYIPVVIAGVLSIVSVGAATPALAAALALVGAEQKLAANQRAKDTSETQSVLNNAANINMDNVNADVSAVGAMTDAQKKYIFFAIIIIILSVIVLLKFKK